MESVSHPDVELAASHLTASSHCRLNADSVAGHQYISERDNTFLFINF